MNRAKLVAWIAGLGLASLVFAGNASATCSIDLSSFKSVSGRTQESLLRARLTPAVFHPDTFDGGHFIAVDNRASSSPSIVGLWRFQFSAELGGDFGTTIWHGDGTELTLSAGRDPAAGNVCMGVWRQTGPYTYELNHIAMGHDGPPGGPPSPTFTNTVHLHEFIKLAHSGNSYTGTIHAVISAANPGHPFDESNVIAQVNGTVTATRVQP